LSEILDDTLVTNEKADNTKELKNEFTLSKVDPLKKFMIQWNISISIRVMVKEFLIRDGEVGFGSVCVKPLLF
jgi:hypothetical protein